MIASPMKSVISRTNCILSRSRQLRHLASIRPHSHATRRNLLIQSGDWWHPCGGDRGKRWPDLYRHRSQHTGRQLRQHRDHHHRFRRVRDPGKKHVVFCDLYLSRFLFSKVNENRWRCRPSVHLYINRYFETVSDCVPKFGSLPIPRPQLSKTAQITQEMRYNDTTRFESSSYGRFLKNVEFYFW